MSSMKLDIVERYRLSAGTRYVFSEYAVVENCTTFM